MSSSPTSPATLVDVTMPQMGVSVAEGTIAEWKKRPGDWVEADETIVEISTDKIETEVPSPATGRVAEIVVDVGATVDVGTVLARIDTAARPGEPHADEHDDAPAAGAAVADSQAAAAGPIGGAPAEADRDGGEAQAAARAGGGGAAPATRRTDDGGGARPSPGADGNGHAPPISPVVRRIASEHGIDLAQVEGTGRRGRVTKRDVLAFLERGGAPEDRPEPVLHIESPYREGEPPAPAPERAPDAPAPQLAAPPAEPAPAGAGDELSLMRRRIGEHMRRSLDTAAHCTTVVEADMSRIEDARGRLSYLPFVARAVIGALREFPQMNQTWEGEDRLVRHDAVHLGIAVSLGEDGLIVPVVHDAHLLSHEGLAERIRDLADRARRRELRPEEVRGGTFTITNPGRYGALLATPIINQPQVGILDLEAVVRRPVVVGGDSIAIRPMTYLCMSWDHRALDGAYAAQFMSAVRRRIEEWSG